MLRFIPESGGKIAELQAAKDGQVVTVARDPIKSHTGRPSRTKKKADETAKPPAKKG